MEGLITVRAGKQNYSLLVVYVHILAFAEDFPYRSFRQLAVLSGEKHHLYREKTHSFSIIYLFRGSKG